MKDKRCPICREVFTPQSGKQRICKRCRPYYFVSCGFGKNRGEDEARRRYLADMAAQHIQVSDFPAAPGCEGCKYWKPISVGGRACHYCIDEKTSRPCLPGRNCTVRVNKKKGEKQTCEFSE